MKITVLSENTSTCGLPAEHGLSLYIEVLNHKLLFDMGQGSLFAENAKALNVDLHQVDLAVLSHGHYDHGGGLLHFLDLNDSARVYLSKYAFETHLGADGRNIGLDPSLSGNDRLFFTEGVTQIAPGLTLYDCNDTHRFYNTDSGGLQVFRNGKAEPEDFIHEQYLLVEDNNRKILISGCSHKGICNLTEWFDPDILIGGFHFFRLPLDDTLQNFARTLNMHHTVYYTCHCTGTAQYEYIHPLMKNLNYISAGQTIEV